MHAFDADAFDPDAFDTDGAATVTPHGAPPSAIAMNLTPPGGIAAAAVPQATASTIKPPTGA